MIKKCPEDKVASICANIRKFYKVAARYTKEKMPMKDELLHHAEVADISTIRRASFSSVRYFIERFSCMKPDCSMDTLEEEFSCLQVEELGDILTIERIDEQWGKVSEIRDTTGNKKFSHISKLALSILLIPHSNATCERVFSAVRKIRTDFRSSMGPNTLEAMCLVKMDMQFAGAVCHQQEYTREQTKQAKNATEKFNRSKRID